MNEAEKHYSGQGGGHGTGTTGTTTSGAGTQGSQSTHGQGASAARDGLNSAAETARSATEAARQGASDIYNKATSWGRDGLSSASRGVGGAGRRSAAEFNRGRRGVEAFVEDNPIMVGVVGLAAGLLVGALLPGTRRENEVFGRYADEVRDQGLRYAREMAEQGRHFVEENLEVARGGGTDRDMGDESRAA